MKYAAKIFGDEPKKADLRKFSHLEPGQIVSSLDGSVFRVLSKIAGPDGAVYKLANLQGKPVATPADFRPVGKTMARFASWMRYHLAYNKDFDLYIKSYIEQHNNKHPDAPLPVEPIGPDGKPFRWAKWFQSEIAPKLYVNQKGEHGDEMKDEAIHEMLFTVLGHRHILDDFAGKMKNFDARVQKLDVAKQLTIYLARNFKYRVEEMRESLQRSNPEQEMSMLQPGDPNEEGQEEHNILDTEQFGVGKEDIQNAEAQKDVTKFRQGFGSWLMKSQGEKVGNTFLALFDIYWNLIGQSGKSAPKEDVEKSERNKRREETQPWMLQRGDLEEEWKARTGLSFGSLKDYLGRLPGLLEQYINSHAAEIGENSIFVQLLNQIKKQRPAPARTKARPAKATMSSLNLAGFDFEDESREDPNPVEGPDYYAFPKSWDDKEQAPPPLPNESHGVTSDLAEQMLKSIRPGDRVTILRPAGRGRNGQEWAEATGKVVMRSSHGGWVLNMGGKHGTPGVADAGNIISVRKAKQGAVKIAKLIGGPELTPEMRKQVLSAFIYRWTLENPRRTSVYHCDKCDINDPYVNEQSAEGHQHPTIPLISDDQWIREHAFYFTNDGRLYNTGDKAHAQPVYLAQHNARRFAAVEIKFAIERAAYSPEPLQHKSEEEMEEFLLENGWVKENGWHGATWWMGKQMWYKKDYEESIPYQCTEDAYEKELDLQDTQTDEADESIYRELAEEGRQDQELHEEKTSTETGIHSCCGGEGDSHKPGCSVAGTEMTAAEHEDGTCQDCGAALNNAEGKYCGACLPGHVDEDMHKEGMIGHDFDNADGQAIRPETHIENPDRVEGEADRAEFTERNRMATIAPPENWQCLDCGNEGMLNPQGGCEACGSQAVQSVLAAPPEYARHGIGEHSMNRSNPEPVMAAGSNSGKDDERGAGDVWREFYYGRYEGLPGKELMNGMLNKDASSKCIWCSEAHDYEGNYCSEECADAAHEDMMGADKIADGTTTTTMQDQNATFPGTMNNAEPMAVPDAIDQTPGPHSPNAPMTAPRTPTKQPRIVDVPSGTVGDDTTAMTASEDADWESMHPEENENEEFETDLGNCPACGSAALEVLPIEGTDTHDVFCEICEEIVKPDVPNSFRWHGPPMGGEHVPGKGDFTKEENDKFIAYMKSLGASSKFASLPGAGKMIGNERVVLAEDWIIYVVDHEGKMWSYDTEVWPEWGQVENAMGLDQSKPQANVEAMIPFAEQHTPEPIKNGDGTPMVIEQFMGEIKSEEEMIKEGAGAAVPAVNPNVAQQQALHQQLQMPQQPGGGASVAIMPGDEEADEPSIGRHTVEPELPDSKYHMQGALYHDEEAKLAKLAGLLNTFTVTFEDGNSLTTDFNGSLDEANAYYLNQFFNVGGGDQDNVVKAVAVEQV